ncbi:MBL fold metallo-hydrolase [Candidatus Clostridium stratigraminis]|uniref:MBL fold metallo-hydrolase n=1 Tax=Candidatus Clostridium stratigraminis TaxID=3381661 RepID=A0ABW8T6F0_9CLOT
MKVNYLYNSSFKIETKNYVLILDYYNDFVEGKERISSKGVIGREDLETNKEVLVFSSHSHGDHFNKLIFDWNKINPKIKYILSSDIKAENSALDITKISAYEELQVMDVYIKAYGSTDIGISFLIKVDGITIFHAGDLNWWDWYDESDEDNKIMEKKFKEEVYKIKGERIDAAFFSVDSRLKGSFALGPNYFIKELAPKAFIPMHFREDFEVTKEFADKNIALSTKVFEIKNRGEEFIIPLP